MSINEVRYLEDLRPIIDPAAEAPRVPLANVNLNAADLTALDKRITMAQKLINSGFDPAETLAALNIPAIAHTGLPTVQLQQAATFDPENPSGAYEVQ